MIRLSQSSLPRRDIHYSRYLHFNAAIVPITSEAQSRRKYHLRTRKNANKGSKNISKTTSWVKSSRNNNSRLSGKNNVDLCSRDQRKVGVFSLHHDIKIQWNSEIRIEHQFSIENSIRTWTTRRPLRKKSSSHFMVPRSHRERRFSLQLLFYTRVVKQRGSSSHEMVEIRHNLRWLCSSPSSSYSAHSFISFLHVGDVSTDTEEKSSRSVTQKSALTLAHAH